MLLVRDASNPLVENGYDEYSITQTSMISTRQQKPPMDGFFMNLDKRNSIFLSPTSKVSSPLLTSIMALTVAKNGLPRRIRI